MVVMEINVAKVSKIVGGIAAFIVASGVIYTSSLNAFDTAHDEFITVNELSEVFDDRRVAEIKKFIRRMQWQENNGGLTPQQQWELSDAYDELEDLQ